MNAGETAEPARTTVPHETNEEVKEESSKSKEKDRDADKASKFINGKYNPFNYVK